MTIQNITHDITAPFAMSIVPPFAQVQATAKIVTTKGRIISPGDVIVIDSTQSPDNDQMVIVGKSIQAFTGQQHSGVVIGFMSETT